ncbi:MAG: hypothetical protein CVU34_06815 [Betaproteobacteria bacterium HGW-Betaproteobacteria-7]|jgi:uncharacterized protein (TIGR02001 family)|nr:MAG: hypothetical protein CVU34_06815 [Betaproteobacteria bacterium HGW-Betaproteobacteria-7]
MKKNVLKAWITVLAALLAAVNVVHAEEAPAPAYSISANVGLFSQYVFRGISYTQEKPAVQGGFDLAHQSGLYLGIWGTNVSDAALNNAVGEIDIYGGYANTVGDVTYDLGFLQFIFPNGQINGTDEKYDTLELSAALTWKFLNVKYSHTVTDYFGINDNSLGLGRGGSKGSNYIEGNLAYEFLPSWKGLIHVGRQHVRNYDEYDFTDWKVGVTKDFAGGWQAGIAWITTNADKQLYTVCDGNSRCKDTGANKWLVHVKRTF